MGERVISSIPIYAFLSNNVSSDVIATVTTGCVGAHNGALGAFSFSFGSGSECFGTGTFRPRESLPCIGQVLRRCRATRSCLRYSRGSLFGTLFTTISTGSVPNVASISSSLLCFYDLIDHGGGITLANRYTSRVFNKCP